MREATARFLDDWMLIIFLVGFGLYVLFISVSTVIIQYQKLFPHKPKSTNFNEIEALKHEIEELKKKNNQKRPSHSADDTSTPIF